MERQKPQIEEKLKELNDDYNRLMKELKRLRIAKILKPIIGTVLAFSVLFLLGTIKYKFSEGNYFFSGGLLLVTILVASTFKFSPSDNIVGLALSSKETINYAEMVLVNEINYINDMNYLDSTGELTMERFNDTKYMILSGSTKISK